MPGGANTNQSAVTQLDVVLREIEELYELANPSAPTPTATTSNEQLDVYMEQGLRPLTDTSIKFPKGMYEHIGMPEWGMVTRTFHRQRSRPIDGKWVYVFSRAGDDSTTFRLAYELYFEKGSYRYVQWEKQLGKDKRDPGGDPSKHLMLDVVGSPSRPRRSSISSSSRASSSPLPRWGRCSTRRRRR